MPEARYDVGRAKRMVREYRAEAAQDELIEMALREHADEHEREVYRLRRTAQELEDRLLADGHLIKDPDSGDIIDPGGA